MREKQPTDSYLVSFRTGSTYLEAVVTPAMFQNTKIIKY